MIAFHSEGLTDETCEYNLRAKYVGLTLRLPD